MEITTILFADERVELSARVNERSPLFLIAVLGLHEILTPEEANYKFSESLKLSE